MSKKAWLIGLSVVVSALSLGVAAQTPSEDEDQDQTAAETERPGRAFERPHDRESLYRLQESGGYGYFGYYPAYEFGERYRRTGYYRLRNAYPSTRAYNYSRSWYGGAQPHHRTTWITSGRRSFGHRGELFLVAPTFLAPVVPFNEHSFEDR